MKTFQVLNAIGSVVKVVSAPHAQTYEQNLPNYEEFQKQFGKLNISESEYLNQIKTFKKFSKTLFIPKTKTLNRIMLNLSPYDNENGYGGYGGGGYSNSKTDTEKLFDVDSKLSELSTEFTIKAGAATGVAALLFWAVPAAAGVGLLGATLWTQVGLLSAWRSDVTTLMNRLQLKSTSSYNAVKTRELRDSLVKKFDDMYKVLIGFAFISWVFPVGNGLIYLPQIVATLKELNI